MLRSKTKYVARMCGLVKWHLLNKTIFQSVPSYLCPCMYIIHDYNELEMKDASTDFVFIIFTFLNVKECPNYIQLLNFQLFNNIFISQNIFKIAVAYAQKSNGKATLGQRIEHSSLSRLDTSSAFAT